MNKSTVLTGLTMLSLLVGVSSVAGQIIGNSHATNQMNSVLIIDQFDVIHPGVRPGAFGLIGFNNISSQTIKRIKFSLVAYNKGHPVLYPNGKPVLGAVVESGPFAPGNKYHAQTKNPIWSSHKISYISCARVVGLEITYTDGTSQSVDDAMLRQYFTPQMNKACLNQSMERNGQPG